MNKILKLNDIYLSINGKKILKGINASAHTGELTVLLGDNGTGKTTLFNCLSGILEMDAGSIQYKSDIVDPASSVFNKNLAYIIDNGGTIPLLTVKEQLQLQCYLNNLNKAETFSRVEKLIGLLELEKYENYRAEELSAGGRKKLGIALGLVNDSDIFLFDEPFSSLDFKASTKLLNILKTLKEKGAALILSTHTPGLLSGMTDRIWILSEGKINEIVLRDEIESILNRTSEVSGTDVKEKLSWMNKK